MKNLHPKKITIWAALSAHISPIFIVKNVDGPVYRKILKKKAFPQFTTMKKFLKFRFEQDGAKAHTADLTLDLVETHFKKHIISNHFSLKKKGLELAAVQPQSQSFELFPLGLCKASMLCKQTDNDFDSAKKYDLYFRLAWRRSGHFLIGYVELPEAFGASCGGWTHRKCYNLSCLTRVLPSNFVHSTIFKNSFHCVYSERPCTFLNILEKINF